MFVGTNRAAFIMYTVSKQQSDFSGGRPLGFGRYETGPTSTLGLNTSMVRKRPSFSENPGRGNIAAPHGERRTVLPTQVRYLSSLERTREKAKNVIGAGEHDILEPGYG